MFKEYIKQNIIIGSVKKSKFSFSCHLHLHSDKKSIMLKKIQRKNLIQNLIFLKLPSAYVVLRRKNIM